MNKRILFALTALLLLVNVSRADVEAKDEKEDDDIFYDAQSEFDVEPTFDDEELAYFDAYDTEMIEKFGICGWSNGYYDCDECCGNHAFAKSEWKNGECKCSD